MSAIFNEYITFVRLGKKDGDPSYTSFKRVTSLETAKKVAFLEHSSLMAMIEDDPDAARELNVGKSGAPDVDAFVIRVAVAEAHKLGIDEYGEIRWSDAADEF